MKPDPKAWDSGLHPRFHVSQPHAGFQPGLQSFSPRCICFADRCNSKQSLRLCRHPGKLADLVLAMPPHLHHNAIRPSHFGTPHEPARNHRGLTPTCRRPEKVAGLVLVAPALPAQPHAFRRAMTATQQLQALARLALLRSDTAGGRAVPASGAHARVGDLHKCKGLHFCPSCTSLLSLLHSVPASGGEPVSVCMCMSHSVAQCSPAGPSSVGTTTSITDRRHKLHTAHAAGKRGEGAGGQLAGASRQPPGPRRCHRRLPPAHEGDQLTGRDDSMRAD